MRAKEAESEAEVAGNWLPLSQVSWIALLVFTREGGEGR